MFQVTLTLRTARAIRLGGRVAVPVAFWGLVGVMAVMPVNQVADTASLTYHPNPASATSGIGQHCERSFAGSRMHVRPFTITLMQAVAIVVMVAARQQAANASAAVIV